MCAFDFTFLKVYSPYFELLFIYKDFFDGNVTYKSKIGSIICTSN